MSNSAQRQLLQFAQNGGTAASRTMERWLIKEAPSDGNMPSVFRGGPDCRSGGWTPRSAADND
jgi:hypothetical protein